MDVTHLEYILDQLSERRRNVYGQDSSTTIMGNWIRAVEEVGIPHTIRHNKKGHPFVEMHRADGTRLAYIHTRLLPSCPKASSAICNDKIATNEILEAKAVRIPWSRTYTEDEAARARKEAFAAHPEVVVKAHSLTLGVGVYLNVREANFEETFRECIALQKRRGHEAKVIVQEMVRGFEMRATVVEGRLDNVLVRIPAYVTGDGTSTIDELIDAKNEVRSHCGFFYDKPIKRNRNMQSFLSTQGITMDSIPAAGELVLLTNISNSTYGGETAVVTDLVSEEFKETALRAAAAIPGLMTAGLDIMVDRFDSTDPVVIEANAYPFAHLSIYPSFGEGTNPLVRYLEAFLARDTFQRSPSAERSDVEAQHLSTYLSYYALKDQLSTAQYA